MKLLLTHRLSKAHQEMLLQNYPNHVLIFQPVVQTLSLDLTRSDYGAIRSASWLFLTSRSVVHHLEEKCPGIWASLSLDRVILSMGPKTDAYVRENGFQGAILPRDAGVRSSQELAQQILQDPYFKQTPGIILRAKDGRTEFQDTLSAHGIFPRVINVYETRVDSLGVEVARQHIVQGLDWLVVSSPSAVQAILKDWKVPSQADRMRWASIGPTTADAVQALGYSVSHVSQRPQLERLLSEILQPS